jgi:hypothetical protein
VLEAVARRAAQEENALWLSASQRVSEDTIEHLILCDLRRTHVADVIAGWNVKPRIAIVGLVHKPHDARQLSGVSNPASEA